MTRYRFGATPDTDTVQRVGKFPMIVSRRVTFTDVTTGEAIIDLALDEAGTQPVNAVTSDDNGIWSVYGPDGVTSMWLDDGDPTTPQRLVVAFGSFAETAAACAAAANAAAASAASISPGTPGGVATLDGATRLTEAQVPVDVAKRGDLMLSVRDYDAVGDGVAGDAAAIQGLLDNVAAAGGGVVYVAPGPLGVAVYKCDAPLNVPSKVHLKGAGPAVQLKFTWGDATSAPAYYIGNSDMVNGNTGIRITDLHVEGASDGTPWGPTPTPASGILMRRVDGLSVSDNYLTKIPGPAIAYQGCSRVRINDNEVYATGRGGIIGWGFQERPLVSVAVTGNVVHSTGDDGISVQNSPNAATVATGPQSRRITITGNTIYGNSTVYANGAGRGILVKGVLNLAISGNTISDTFSAGVLVQDDDFAALRSAWVTITGNNIDNAGSAGNSTVVRHGLYISAVDTVTISGNTVSNSVGNGVALVNTTRYVIADNIIDNNGTTTTDFGINLAGASATTPDVRYGTVKGNHVSRNSGAGIRARFCDTVTIGGNMVLDNGDAGDGTTNLGAGILLDMTGVAVVEANIATDTRSTGKTQTYGIAALQALASLTLGENYCLGNAVDPGIKLVAQPTVLVKRGNRESATNKNNYDQDTSGARSYSGTGSPEGVVTAPVGSQYRRTDGGAATTLYVKESGTGSTGWIGK